MVDVNGSRFHLLFGPGDWLPLETAGTRLEFSATRTALQLEAVTFQFPTPPGDYLPRPADRRGAGRDRYGNWYWIAPSGEEILFRGARAGASEHFWSGRDWQAPPPTLGGFQPKPPRPPETVRLAGLAVTEHHYLAAGTLEPPGLLVFDLHGGGAPTWLVWPQDPDPSARPFEPFDLAPAPQDGLWLLDRAGRRYWHLDHRFQVGGLPEAAVPAEAETVDDFAAPGQAARRRVQPGFPASFAIDEAAVLDGRALPDAGEPIGIEALPDGSVLLLTADPAHIFRFQHRGGQLFAQWTDLNDLLRESLPGSYVLRGHDLAFVPGPPSPVDRLGEATRLTGTLFLVASDGNQSFAFHLTATDRDFALETLSNYYPMRLYAGKGLVSAGGKVYYDLVDRWVPLFEQPRPRYYPEGFTQTGPLDGKEPGCTWHRLFVDGCIPPGAEIRVETRAADHLDILDQLPWQSEPRFYRRSDGPELPYLRALFPGGDEPDGYGAWELLFQRAVGRFLQIRLTLRGTGRVTPRLYALRAYYPRFSYLKEYLPAVYQADETSASFIDRYLANVEGFYTAIEGRIEQAQALFDVRTAAPEHLEWLAGWLGAVLDPAWDEPRRRLFIGHVMQIYAERGTLAGLIRAVRLAVDACPDASLFAANADDLTRSVMGRQSVRVVESFLTRSTPGVVYGDPSESAQPSIDLPNTAWTPNQSAAALHERFRAYLKALYPGPDGSGSIQALQASWGVPLSSFNQVRLSPVLPAHAAPARDWQRFLREGIGFTYAEVSAADEPAYQLFLARRYGQVSRLNDAYYRTGSGRYASFYQVRLPAEEDFPSEGARLFDWVQFVSLLLPIRRSAHRFTVLVPVFATRDLYNLYEQEQRVRLVQRIVDTEKPAHTRYEVKPYWAMFRVGESRLGMDTVINEGSRFMALVLGQGYLAESALGYARPFEVTDRIITGREPPGPDLVL